MAPFSVQYLLELPFINHLYEMFFFNIPDNGNEDDNGDIYDDEDDENGDIQYDERREVFGDRDHGMQGPGVFDQRGNML